MKLFDLLKLAWVNHALDLDTILTTDTLWELVGHLAGVPPTTLDTTPRKVVYQHEKLKLLHVLPIKKASVSTPILLFPPLMVRPYIFDLSPSLSLLRTFRDAGFNTYLADFGIPDKNDHAICIDDYVTRFVPTCVDQTLRDSGADEIALVGYCMGGLFGLIYMGTYQDPRVRAVVTIGSPINFSKLGMFSRVARPSTRVVDKVIDLVGNVPGSLASLVFKMVTGQFFLSYLHLIQNLDDKKALNNFRAINYWINNLIAFPQEAFRQFFREVIVENKLFHNELFFEQRRCDLRKVTCPLLAFAGAEDRVVPPEAIAEIVKIVGSPDKELVIAPGGHVGVFAGSRAPEVVWSLMIDWLGSRLSSNNLSNSFSVAAP